MAVRVDPLGWADPALRRRLETDPAAVARERGVNVPPDLPPAILHEVIRLVSLVWQDGQIVPIERFRIDPADEGLLFGRGVWESTRTVNGVPWLWAEHLERMTRTAELLDIKVDPAKLPDAQTVTAFTRALTVQDVVIRLNATAGAPGRAGTVWMSASLRQLPKPSVRLKSQRNNVPPNQPYLVWKTFQYASRLRTGQEAAKDGEFDTALMVNDAGELLEASHANIFVRFADGWATPPLESGPMLPGTVRQHVLTNAPLNVHERRVTLDELGQATEVFLTNSNVGIVPVTQIDDHKYPVGADTQALVKWIQGV